MAEQVDMAALARKAQAGDPDAQYRMAAMLSGEGHKDRAVALLRKAAASGHRDARFTLASFTLQGHLVKRNPGHAATILARNEAAGHAASRHVLAVLTAMGHGRERDWPGAVALMAAGVEAGDPAAMRIMAGLAHLYGAAPDLADQLFLAAAMRGDIPAALAVVRRSQQGVDLVDPGLQAHWLSAAHQAGHPLAADLARAGMAQPVPFSGAPDPVPDISEAGEAGESLWDMLSADPGSLPLPTAKPLNDAPRVAVLAGLVPPVVCDLLVGLAAPAMQPARIVDPSTGQARPDPYRHCFTATLWPDGQDLLGVAVAARMAAVAGLPDEQGEMLSVLAYQQGMTYGPHYDCLTPGEEGANRELSRSGQRPHTVLLSLNDGYEGGETRFPRLELSHRGAPGDALLFDNVTADGQRDDRALHESVAVKQGLKWIASRWMRSMPYVF
ncbi:2OG-Fe(II) oxygenase [Yunchengibacter salinarum]|uniref:2OG-Fe(II) oxygenase n=1 Tax=Yunchengibacter salinarum TaxID=3133399 RepID=UPI0035B5F55A